MNRDNLQQITNHYIERFGELNTPPIMEYYKWQIIRQFKPMMDAALAAPIEEFPARLEAARKLTRNLIDSRILPFKGLVEFAGEEPNTVRSMFRNLLQMAEASTDQKITAIDGFLEKSHQLRDKHSFGSHLYNDDHHSVTGYLFLYDPDHNYQYKATDCREFADCIGFYDDWDYGANTKLDVFFRMCDEVLAAIKEDEALMATAESRFEIDPEGMHPDKEKHILLFDLIYCCSTYGLFRGVNYAVPTTAERRLIQERKDKAREIAASLDEARQQLDALNGAEACLRTVFTPDAVIHHRSFGDGTIREITGLYAVVQFANQVEKKMDLAACAVNGLVAISNEHVQRVLQESRDVLRRAEQIRKNVDRIERELVPYSEYLD